MSPARAKPPQSLWRQLRRGREIGPRDPAGRLVHGDDLAQRGLELGHVFVPQWLQNARFVFACLLYQFGHQPRAQGRDEDQGDAPVCFVRDALDLAACLLAIEHARHGGLLHHQELRQPTYGHRAPCRPAKPGSATRRR